MCFRNLKFGIVFIFYLMLCVLPVKHANAKTNRPVTPESIQSGTIIDAVHAKQLLDKGNAVFFDTRSALNYGKGHIAGAICMPYKEKSGYTEDFEADLDKVDLSKLPDNKKQVVIFYSHGNTGWKSYKAAAQSIHRGYTRVYWFREGFSSWMELGFPVE